VATPSSSSSITGGGLCDGFVEGTTRTHYGKSKAQFCDERDGIKYVYVQIGTQTWMAENLNYNANGSKCYLNDETRCTTYGRLYDWLAATAVCPSGWHLPSDEEWTTLVNYAGVTAGTKLKAQSRWDSDGTDGTDAFGFAALPGGYMSSAGFSNDISFSGYWWTATVGNIPYAYRRGMFYDENAVSSNYNTLQDFLYSVRCVKD
jgi:uncharacterized protein (TIGR02145 family)